MTGCGPKAVLLAPWVLLAACGGDGGSPTDPDPPGPPPPNQPPVAAFMLSVEEGSAPLAVTFDAGSSSDPDGTLVSYAWTFGDGLAGTGRMVSHTFEDAGLFKVQLTVTDDRGGQASTADTVFVVSPPGTGANTIEGVLWFDRDLDGRRGPGEPGLPRHVVFLDQDGDGTRDPGESLVFTSSDGSYRFSGLEAGTGYRVTQALPFGWSNTTPGPPEGAPSAPVGPTRIISGEEVGISTFPFQVALMAGPHQFCGGTLVNSRWVLTAAHCLEGAFPADIEVLAGTEDLTSGGERLAVGAIRIHPDFSNTLDYDVGLLRLQQPVLRPRVFLQTRDQPSLSAPGDTATVIGWGEIGDGADAHRLLRVSLPIITNKQCSEEAGINFGLIGDRTLCAGGLRLGRGPCFGDSGGPLLVPYQGSWAQIGIVSFSVTREFCGQVPAAFSRVSELYDYIVDVAKIEVSGFYVVEWSSSSTVRADFGNFH